MPTEISRRPYQTRSVSSPRKRYSLVLFSLGVMVVAALSVSGVFAWRWLQNPAVFPIRHVVVEGQLTHESLADVESRIESHLSGGFFSLHVSAAKEALSGYPWIASVSFRRVWQDTLKVTVTEQQAIARFGKAGVLNAQGDVFYPDLKSIPANLPDLEGPIDQSKALFSFYQTANTLSKVIGLSVIALHETTNLSWDLVLSNQIKVMLGRQQAIQRFSRFIAVYPKILASSSKTILSVDLRYPNGIAVQYQNTPGK